MAKQAELPVNSVVCGDAFSVLPSFPKASVDMVMFSPPYWGLRDYKVKTLPGVFAKGGMGLEPHPQQYIERMVVLCRLLRRVLKKQGSLYLNLGDTYFGGHSGGTHSTKSTFQTNKNKKMLMAQDYQRRHISDGSKWLQPKQKLMMPSRVACALQEDGWILRNDIIWHKPNHMPSSVKDRLTSSYEHIFHFVKARRYFYDLDAIRQPHKQSSVERVYRQIKGGVKEDGYPQKKISQVLRDYKRHILTGKGKNPGDTITTSDSAKFLSPQLSSPVRHLARSRDKYRTLGLPEGNIKGKNPADVINVLEQRAKIGGKQREAYEAWLKWKKNNPEGTYEDFYNFAKSKKLSKWSGKYNGHQKESAWGNYLHYLSLPHPKGKNPADVIKTKYTEDFSPQKPQTQQLTNIRLTSPMGKNPSDFWSINTKPFPQAHFAVYPLEICRLPILSSCPRQICVGCGKPRKRIIKRSIPKIGVDIPRKKTSPKGELYQDKVGVSPNSALRTSGGDRWVKWKQDHPDEFVGFSDCGCNKGWQAGIVLDPMCGSGTTLIQAHKLGRRWIGIDLNPSYVEMAKKRVERECSQWLSSFMEEN